MLTHSESFNRSAFAIDLESRCHFSAPVVNLAKQENGSDRARTCFAAHLFQSIFKIHADPAGNEDRNVEIKFGLSFDEAVEAIGHLGVDVGILTLLIDDRFAFRSKIDDVGARENPEGFGDAVAHLHGARAASGQKSEGNFAIEQGMADLRAHLQ